MEENRKDVTFEDFIYQQPKQLTPQFCKNLIEKYETNEQALQMRTQGSLGDWEKQAAKSFKQSEDVNITELPDFEIEDKTLNIALAKLSQNYLDHICSFNYGYLPLLGLEYEDSGFQMQKTTPAGHYRWHHDQIGRRYYTYIFYLNDVNNAGETQFANGLKVKPEEGKGLMFPASWQYVHQGVDPIDEIKYIVTGWISEAKPSPIPLENELELI